MATKLGSALRAAREAKGLSLREFDGRSGCRLRRYLRIENGIRKDPAFSTVAKLARSLGVSLDSLAGGGAGSPAASRIPARVVSHLQRARADAVSLVARIDEATRTLEEGKRTR